MDVNAAEGKEEIFFIRGFFYASENTMPSKFVI